MWAIVRSRLYEFHTEVSAFSDTLDRMFERELFRYRGISQSRSGATDRVDAATRQSAPSSVSFPEKNRGRTSVPAVISPPRGYPETLVTLRCVMRLA